MTTQFPLSVQVDNMSEDRLEVDKIDPIESECAVPRHFLL